MWTFITFLPDVLLIKTRRFQHVSIYIFYRKFHLCAEKSAIFSNTNRVADTVRVTMTGYMTSDGRWILVVLTSEEI